MFYLLSGITSRCEACSLKETHVDRKRYVLKYRALEIKKITLRCHMSAKCNKLSNGKESEQ